MIDFILFLFVLGIFGTGVWLGLHIGIVYGSIGKWFEAIGKRLSDKDK
jgi:hypothetical protein